MAYRRARRASWARARARWPRAQRRPRPRGARSRRRARRERRRRRARPRGRGCESRERRRRRTGRRHRKVGVLRVRRAPPIATHASAPTARRRGVGPRGRFRGLVGPVLAADPKDAAGRVLVDHELRREVRVRDVHARVRWPPGIANAHTWSPAPIDAATGELRLTDWTTVEPPTNLTPIPPAGSWISRPHAATARAARRARARAPASAPSASSSASRSESARRCAREGGSQARVESFDLLGELALGQQHRREEHFLNAAFASRAPAIFRGARRPRPRRRRHCQRRPPLRRPRRRYRTHALPSPTARCALSNV